MRSVRAWAVVMAAVLAGCAKIVPPPAGRPAPPRPVASRPAPTSVRPPVIAPRPVTPAPAAPGTPTATARSTGITAGPEIATLALSPDAAARALAAFRFSCPALLRRTDLSGLTRPADWQGACSAAAAAGDPVRFFETQFEAVRVGDGQAFATGYYEPEIAGSRVRAPGYDTPVYARPRDIVEVDLGQFAADLKGRKLRGRIEGQAFVPYFDRGQIYDGALAGRGLEIAWAADQVELFFLEVQGSGRLRLPDGTVMRIGFDGQNGRDYTGIGALMRQRGLLGPGQATMQGIMAWVREHPAEGQAILRENKSYVFFRELTGPGPLGALNVPVVGGVSVAADPRFIPLGAPVLLSMDRAEASGLWVAQDTGGAIKGANRVDTFWGAGDRARVTAGGMSTKGSALLFLPVGTLARLQAEANGGPQPQ